MSKKELYPHLASKYPFENFEIIAEVIDTYFSDLFQLDVLDSEANKNASGGYAELFDWYIQQLKDLFTPEEVVVKLNKLINNKESRKKLLQHFTFVPAIAHKSSRQIGYLEKLAVGELKIAEPLTRLDMMRSVYGTQRRSKSHLVPHQHSIFG